MYVYLMIGLFVGSVLGIALWSMLAANRTRDTEAVVDALGKYIFCIGSEVEHEKAWNKVMNAFHRTREK